QSRSTEASPVEQKGDPGGCDSEGKISISAPKPGCLHRSLLDLGERVSKLRVKSKK
ncbi:hypothetical protein A2U01_0072721, partial [Trifolium medium]|nr:hypothetical protein [Trifolium medium]